MNALLKISHWGEDHYPRVIGIIRIFLGLFLIYKGLNYMFNIEKIQLVTTNMDQVLFYLMMFQIVIFVHFVGGIFIAIGVHTRLADAVQIPILVGALFVLKHPNSYVTPGGSTELAITVLILVLLLFIMIFGTGKFSLEKKKKTQPETDFSW